MKRAENETPETVADPFVTVPYTSESLFNNNSLAYYGLNVKKSGSAGVMWRKPGGTYPWKLTIHNDPIFVNDTINSVVFEEFEEIINYQCVGHTGSVLV
jgi:hypothetical protein